MPEEIGARILRLPGYGAYAWEADDTVNTLTLAVRATAAAPTYSCERLRERLPSDAQWAERRIRDLPRGT